MGLSNVLVVGGTSGLGLELAKKLSNFDNVCVVGRHDPKVSGLNFIYCDLGKVSAGPYRPIHEIMYRTSTVGPIDLFIYAAGFYQGGTIRQLSDSDMDFFKGNMEEAIGRIQKAYGYSKDEARKEYEKFKNSNSTLFGSETMNPKSSETKPGH